MAYSKQTWNNGVTGGTPINADRLNHMEDGIENPVDSIPPGTYVQYSEGLLAARPEASTVPPNTLYLATNVDGGTLYISDGATWRKLAAGVDVSGGGGGLSAVTDTSVVFASSLARKIDYPEAGAIRIDPTPAYVFPREDDHNAFPGVALLPSGRLVLGYRTSTSHDSAVPGVMNVHTSDDLAKTWSGATTIIDRTATQHDTRSFLPKTLTDGTLVATYFRSFNQAGVLTRSSHFITTDDGVEWSAEGDITSSFTNQVGIEGPIVELDDGTWLAPLYALVDVPTDRWSAVVVRSTTRGATWAGEVVVGDGLALNKKFTEWWIAPLANGTLYALLRESDSNDMFRSTSSDGGLTWTAPVSTFDGYGRPAVIQLASGVLLTIYRSVDLNVVKTYHGMTARTSSDNGVTWSNEFLLEDVTGSSDSRDMGYAFPLELAPGLILNAYAMEVSSLSSDVKTRYLVEGAGATPVGAVERPLLRFQDRASLLVYDGFTQPNNWDGLGKSDSGHTWVADGDRKWGRKDGAAFRYTGSTGFPLIDAGTANVIIRSEVQTATGSSAGVIFRGVDLDNNLQLLIGNANVRLAKRDAGAFVVLVTSTDALAIKTGIRRVQVVAVGDRIVVFIDGRVIVDHTLSAGDQTTYGARTKHGIYGNDAGISKWLSFGVWSA